MDMVCSHDLMYIDCKLLNDKGCIQLSLYPQQFVSVELN